MKLTYLLIAFLCCSVQAQTLLVLRPTADSDTTGVGIVTVELTKDTNLVSKVISAFPVVLSLHGLRVNDTIYLTFTNGNCQTEWIGPLGNILMDEANVLIVRTDTECIRLHIQPQYHLSVTQVKPTQKPMAWSEMRSGCRISGRGCYWHMTSPTFYLTRFDRCGEYDMLRLTPGVVGMGQEPPTITR